MKKTIAILLAAMMLFAVTCCCAEPLMGGWSVAEDNGITEENKAVFDKALDGLVGVNYKPIAYLGSQVVAGRNHCFLATATVVYPNAVPTLVMVFIYEDLQGNATVTNIAPLDMAALSVPAEPTAE